MNSQGKNVSKSERMVRPDNAKKTGKSTKNFESTIKGGVIVISIGQDLKGESGQHTRLTWKMLRKALESFDENKTLRIIPHSIKIEKNGENTEAIDSFVAPYRSYNGDYEPNEYYLSNCKDDEGILTKMDPFNDILYRLMHRKYMQLTDKGRRGYVHILLDTLYANLYLRLKEGESPGGKQVINLQEKWRGLRPEKKEVIEESEDQRWIKSSFKISIFLHVDVQINKPVPVIPPKAVVERFGNLSILVEPSDNSPECPIAFLSRKPGFLYIRVTDDKEMKSHIVWESDQNPSTLKCDDVWENAKKDIRYLNVKNPKESDESYVLLSLYDFLVLYGWFRVVKRTRKKVKSIINKGSLDFKRYLTAMHEMRKYLSTSASVVRTTEKDANAYYFDDATKMPLEFQRTLEDLLDITFYDGRISQYNTREYYMMFRKEVKCSIEGDYVCGNRIISFVSTEKKESKFYEKGVVVLNEDGIRWYISWLIMIGDFVTTLCESFDIHNREFIELERQKLGFRIGHLLRKTKNLVREYDHYYNVRNITDLEMADLYDIMKESLNINRDRNFIDKRLEMLHSSDLTANNRSLQAMIAIFAGITLLVFFFQSTGFYLVSNSIVAFLFTGLVLVVILIVYAKFGFIRRFRD